MRWLLQHRLLFHSRDQTVSMATLSTSFGCILVNLVGTTGIMTAHPLCFTPTTSNTARKKDRFLHNQSLRLTTCCVSSATLGQFQRNLESTNINAWVIVLKVTLPLPHPRAFALTLNGSRCWSVLESANRRRSRTQVSSCTTVFSCRPLIFAAQYRACAYFSESCRAGTARLCHPRAISHVRCPSFDSCPYYLKCPATTSLIVLQLRHLAVAHAAFPAKIHTSCSSRRANPKGVQRCSRRTIRSFPPATPQTLRRRKVFQSCDIGARSGTTLFHAARRCCWLACICACSGQYRAFTVPRREYYQCLHHTAGLSLPRACFIFVNNRPCNCDDTCNAQISSSEPVASTRVFNLIIPPATNFIRFLSLTSSFFARFNVALAFTPTDAG